MAKKTNSVSLLLILAVLVSSFLSVPRTSSAQSATTTVGKVARTSAWMHNKPNPDVRVTNPDGSLAYVNYTITSADSQAEFIPDVKGTQLGAGEADQSEIVPAELFSEFFTADTDDTCLWDATGDLVLPGAINAPSSGDEGDTVRIFFTPRKAKRRILLLRAVVENGRLVKKYAVRGLRSVFDSYPQGVPFTKNAGSGMVKLAETIWVAIPMAPGDDMVFMDSGSIRIQVNRAPGASGKAAWLFGYTVKMAFACDVQPPPDLCEKGIGWLTPNEVMNRWDGCCNFPVFINSSMWVLYSNQRVMNLLMKGNGLLELKGLAKLQAQLGAGYVSLNKRDCNGLEWACILNGDLVRLYGIQETYGLTSVGDWFLETSQILDDWRAGKAVNMQRVNELIIVANQFME